MKIFLIIIVCFLGIKISQAQTIYVSASDGWIWSINYQTCQASQVRPLNLGNIWLDMAMCPGNNNIIYGVNAENKIYMMDIQTGAITTLNTNFNNLFNNGSSYLNSMVCDGNGNLIIGDWASAGIYQYNIASDTWTLLGQPGSYHSGGDLTYYNGQLYWSTDQNEIIQITTSPFSYQLVSNMNVPNIWGINTVNTFTGCSGQKTEVMTACSGNNIYNVNPMTGVCTPKCMGVLPAGVDINGASSVDGNPTFTPITVTANQPTPICQGQAKALTASSNTGVSYTWTPGNLTGSSISVTPNAPTTYTVTAYDNNGCSATTTVSLNVFTRPVLAPTASPSNCNYLNGSALANATGNSPFTYTWLSAGGTNSSLTGLGAGNYTVQVTDVNACTNTATVSITSIGGFTVNPIVPDSICPGGTAQLNVGATGSGPFSYSWSTGATDSSITINPLSSNSYTVIIANSFNCTDTVTGNIVVNDIPTISINSSPSICLLPNGSINTAITGASPFIYSWAPVAGTASVLTGLLSGTYSVLVTDKNGCSQSSLVAVADSGQLVLSVTSPDSVCPGTSVSIQATATGIAPYLYSWSNGSTAANVLLSPLTTDTLLLLVTDAGGCKDSITTIVPVINVPLVYNLSTPNEICQGQSVTLSAQVSSGASPVTYTWLPTGVTNASTTITPTTSGYQYFQINDVCNSLNDSVLLIVNPVPTAVFSDSVVTECKQTCYFFNDQSTITSGTIDGWVWDFGNTKSETDTSSNQNSNYCYANSGNYVVSLQVVSNNGCKSNVSQIISVEVSMDPIATFTPSPVVVDINNPLISFSNFSQNAVNYHWNFGDPNDTKSSFDFTPTHLYSDTGTYCIELMVTSSLGCIDSTIQCITITPDWTLYVPNTFTPNSDGVNDQFVGIGTNIMEYEMWIYDRWGNQIYHCNDINKPWDGKVQNGKSNDIAQIDTYVWVIKIVDVFEKGHQYLGHVNLIK